MSATVGILAYGSLLSCPGLEIENTLVDTIRNVETPFHVEFARKSRGRGDAPTLVPVEDGGAKVMGSIYVINVQVDTGTDILYRREINQVGSEKRYDASAATRPDSVKVRRLCKLVGVDVVLYTKLEANIHPVTQKSLARLAIQSVARTDKNRDGITYLIDAKRNGIATPLTESYEAEILRQSKCASLEEAYRKHWNAVNC